MSIVLHDGVVSKFLLCSCLLEGNITALKIAYYITLNETGTRGDSALATSSCKTTDLKLLFKPKRLLID